MKSSIVLLTLIGLLTARCSPAQVQSRDALLEEYRWKNRLLLVFFEGEEPPASYLRQKQAFESYESGMAERDLLVLDDPEELAPLRQRFGIQPSEGSFTIALIGKDGTEKEEYEGFTDLQVIFDRIDQMPMRQREMRENR